MASNYPPGCTQWHHDRAFAGPEPTPAQINRAQQVMEERARHEAEGAHINWTEWVANELGENSLSAILACAMRADHKALREHMSGLAFDYQQHRIAQAQRSREWQAIIEEEMA